MQGNKLDFLENALAAAGLEKLPKKGKEPYEGLAIIKVKKVGGSPVFCLGKWNEKLGRSVVARDFDPRPFQEVVEVYPYENEILKQKQAEEKAKEDAIREKYQKEADEKAQIKLELKELGVEDLDGTLEELKGKLLAKKNELGDVELDEMKSFLLGLGYSDTYVKNLTFESGKKSVEKIEKLQADITALGGTPAATKDEMEAQLKELKKK